jgi:ABC-type protease/lipase transport system fused ATPase/permease subunit
MGKLAAIERHHSTHVGQLLVTNGFVIDQSDRVFDTSLRQADGILPVHFVVLFTLFIVQQSVRLRVRRRVNFVAHQLHVQSSRHVCEIVNRAVAATRRQGQRIQELSR